MTSEDEEGGLFDHLLSGEARENDFTMVLVKVLRTSPRFMEAVLSEILPRKEGMASMPYKIDYQDVRKTGIPDIVLRFRSDDLHSPTETAVWIEVKVDSAPLRRQLVGYRRGGNAGVLLSPNRPDFELKDIKSLLWSDLHRLLSTVSVESTDSLERAMRRSLLSVLERKGWSSFVGITPEDGANYLATIKESAGSVGRAQRGIAATLDEAATDLRSRMGRFPFKEFKASTKTQLVEIDPRVEQRYVWTGVWIGIRNRGHQSVRLYADLRSLGIWVGVTAYHKKTAIAMLKNLHRRPKILKECMSQNYRIEWWKGSHSRLETNLDAELIHRLIDKDPSDIDLGMWIPYEGNEMLFANGGVIPLIQNCFTSLGSVIKALE